jgi:hypothetical protein
MKNVAMKTRRKLGAPPQREAPTSQPEGSGAIADAHAPRKMSVGENAILTIKLLVVLGLLGATLWGISLWTTPG